MNILISGAAGFIGYHLPKQYVKTKNLMFWVLTQSMDIIQKN